MGLYHLIRPCISKIVFITQEENDLVHKVKKEQRHLLSFAFLFPPQKQNILTPFSSLSPYMLKLKSILILLWLEASADKIASNI